MHVQELECIAETNLNGAIADLSKKKKAFNQSENQNNLLNFQSMAH